MRYQDIAKVIFGSVLVLGALDSDNEYNTIKNNDSEFDSCDRPNESNGWFSLSRFKKKLTKASGLEAKIDQGVDAFVYPPGRHNRKTKFKGNPIDYGMDYEHLKLATNDNLELDAWYVLGSKNKGIILCHGNGGSKIHMRKHARFLNREGYNIIMFDFRGQGKSDGEYVTYGYYEVKDVDAAVREFQRRGINNIGILGVSLGGGVSILAAARNTEIDAVVADAAYADVKNVALHAAKKYQIPDFVAENLVDQVIARASKITGADYSQTNPFEVVSDISPRPILLIHGRGDTIVPTSHARINYRSAKEPKELWITSNGHDNYIWQIKGQEYERRVLNFFNDNL